MLEGIGLLSVHALDSFWAGSSLVGAQGARLVHACPARHRVARVWVGTLRGACQAVCFRVAPFYALTGHKVRHRRSGSFF